MRARFDKYHTPLIQCAREEDPAAYFPPEAAPRARLPAAHGDAGGSAGAPSSASERPASPHPLREDLPRGSQVFGRARRLLGSAIFSRLLREGQPVRCGWFTLKALPNDLCKRRFGCTVRRTAGLRGVARNRLKRWFREAFRRNQGRLPQGRDLLVIILKVPHPLDYGAVEKGLLKACEGLERPPGSSV